MKKFSYLLLGILYLSMLAGCSSETANPTGVAPQKPAVVGGGAAGPNTATATPEK